MALLLKNLKNYEKIYHELCSFRDGYKKDVSKFIPVTIEEITNDCSYALRNGAQMIHLHSRDEFQENSNDPGFLSEIIQNIKHKFPNCAAIFVVSTTGRYKPLFKDRVKALSTTDIDMASLTLSSHNFLKDSSMSSPDMIRKLLKKMNDLNIKPELEIFDIGMLNFAKVLIKEKLITPPIYANLFFGNIAGMQADLLGLHSITCGIPDNWIYSFAGIGQHYYEILPPAITFAHGVRL